MSNRRVDLVIDQVGNKTLLNIQIQDLFLFNGAVSKLDEVNNIKWNLFYNSHIVLIYSIYTKWTIIIMKIAVLKSVYIRKIIDKFYFLRFLPNHENILAISLLKSEIAK